MNVAFPLKRFHIRRFLSSFIDVLYPRMCVGCGSLVEEESSHICWDCRRSFKIIDKPFCIHCGDPADGMVEHDYVCSICRKMTRHFDEARSALRYRGVLRDAIHAFKYENASYLTSDFASFLVACVNTNYSDIDIDGVTYVPLYRRKERQRTYNQAELLAKSVAKQLKLPFLRGVVNKEKDTLTQTDLSLSRRRKNVHNAFKASNADWIDGRRFLLVDDVMTTGATVNEVSKVLKKAGAAGVYVVTLARG